MPARFPRGPIAQLYDSSDFAESMFALCAFVPFFSADEGQVHRAVVAHMRAIFPQSPEPQQLVMQHWWQGTHTIGEREPSTLDPRHPAPMLGFPARLGESLFLAGTELAQSHNCGMLEGAVESAERVIGLLFN